MYDVAIIGAGVIGSFIARNLSKYQLKVVLIEKDTDVANGTSKANSGIIHAGYNAKPGTLKAKLNVKGNTMYDQVCKELDVPFKRVGSFVIAFNECDEEMLEELYQRGLKNGVKHLEILSGEKVKDMEANLSKDVISALYAPDCGIVSPYELTIALAENAVDNGVDLRLETEVRDIEKNNEHFYIMTTQGVIEAKCVVNAAGVYGERINNMITQSSFTIHPRKGQYFVLDKSVGDTIKHVVFQCPSDRGKGVLIVPTVHGNLLVGPDAEYVPGHENFNTTPEGLAYIRTAAKLTCPTLPFDKVITSYAGLRATPDGGDFIIEESREVKGFINVVGMESPGLASAPAIADEAINIIENYLGGFTDKEFYDLHRRKVVRFAMLSNEERAELIKANPKYAIIACRCETVTEAEVVDSINRSVGAKTVDGVKRRVRPGMGRCQGGFCSPRIIKILSRELNLSPLEIEKGNIGSYMLSNESKE